MIEDTSPSTPPDFPTKAIKSLISEYPSRFHNDPLIVRVMVAGRSGIRMLVDEGSAVNIIFAARYDTFQIPPQRLQSAGANIVGFDNQESVLRGKIPLPFSLISNFPSVYVNKLQTFWVIDAPTPFDGILGCPALHSLLVISSSFF